MTDNEKNDVRPTRQLQVVGTEHKASRELKKKLSEYAVQKYRAKVARERMGQLGSEVIALMRRENINALSVEIDVEEERRTCVTELVTNDKLKSKLEDEDDE
jgi:hypothetical protein